jgi:hypothetical protein
MELLLLGLVAGLGFVSYSWWSKGRAGEALPPALPARERTLATLQVGDVVQHLGTDWLVEGVLTLSAAGKPAQLYRLQDGAEVRFLFTGIERGSEGAALLRPAPEATGLGTPERLEVGGHAYHQTARASAAVLRAGSVGARRAGKRVEVASYAAGLSRVVLLAWDDEVEAFQGEQAPESDFELLPGR